MEKLKFVSAVARIVSLCLELRSFSRFVLQQGPALYAYNNAQFSKDDWRGIRMICDSIKVKDPRKVGRFGLGFKSVFHMTGKYSSSAPLGLLLKCTH